MDLNNNVPNTGMPDAGTSRAKREVDDLDARIAGDPGFCPHASPLCYRFQSGRVPKKASRRSAGKRPNSKKKSR